jgi:hypothetical protein
VPGRVEPGWHQAGWQCRAKGDKTLPQMEKLLAEAAAADAAEDACYGDALDGATSRALAARADRRERLAAARDRLAAEGRARRDAQRAGQQAWDAAAAEGRSRAARRPADEPRTNRNNAPPWANITDPDCRVMHQKGYVAGYNGQLVVTAQQVIVGAVLSWHPVDRTLLHPLLDQCCAQLTAAGIRPKLRTVLADSGYVTEGWAAVPLARGALVGDERPGWCGLIALFGAVNMA